MTDTDIPKGGPGTDAEHPYPKTIHDDPFEREKRRASQQHESEKEDARDFIPPLENATKEETERKNFHIKDKHEAEDLLETGEHLGKGEKPHHEGEHHHHHKQ